MTRRLIFLPKFILCPTGQNHKIRSFPNFLVIFVWFNFEFHYKTESWCSIRMNFYSILFFSLQTFKILRRNPEEFLSKRRMIKEMNKIQIFSISLILRFWILNSDASCVDSSNEHVKNFANYGHGAILPEVSILGHWFKSYQQNILENYYFSPNFCIQWNKIESDSEEWN